MRNPKQFLITHYRPLHIFVVMIIFCAVIIITAWILVEKDLWAGIESNLSITKQNEELRKNNQRINARAEKLEERIVMLERTNQLERQTITNLQQDIIQQQNEVYKLKRELEFYQEIIGSANGSNGLNIQGLRIEKISIPMSYYLNLILTYVAKSDRVAAGRLSILLEGVLDGNAKIIDIRDLMPSETLASTFRFSNFKRVEGSIVLPEGFLPHRVIVRVQQEGQKKTPEIERIFDWTKAVK